MWRKDDEVLGERATDNTEVSTREGMKAQETRKIKAGVKVSY